MNQKTETISIENNEIGMDELCDSYIAGKILGLSPRTVRDMGVKRTVPVYRIGTKTNRFRVGDLVEYVRERRCEPNG